MNFKKGDAIVIELYGIKLYGRVVRFRDGVLRYRDELGKLFATSEIESIKPLSPELAAEYGIYSQQQQESSGES